MGRIEKITCRNCQSSWELNVGAGRMHFDARFVLPFFDGNEIEEKIRSSRFDFSFQKGHCEYCKKVISVPVIKIGNEETKYGKCPECKKLLSEKSIPLACCPNCNQDSLTIERIGMWD